MEQSDAWDYEITLPHFLWKCLKMPDVQEPPKQRNLNEFWTKLGGHSRATLAH